MWPQTLGSTTQNVALGRLMKEGRTSKAGERRRNHPWRQRAGSAWRPIAERLENSEANPMRPETRKGGLNSIQASGYEVSRVSRGIPLAGAFGESADTMTALKKFSECGSFNLPPVAIRFEPSEVLRADHYHRHLAQIRNCFGARSLSMAGSPQSAYA